MELIRLLLRASRGMLWISAAGGLVAGGAAALLLALIDTSIAQPHAASWQSFAVLCVITIAARLVTELWMVRSVLELIYRLRVRLCCQILASPLPQLETHGAHALLAAVTEDVTAITHGLPMLGLAITDAVVVVMCLGYLAWVTPLGAAALIAIIAVGVLLCRAPLARARRSDILARHSQDTLFGHLHTLVEGSKQLKLHRRAQTAFLAQALGPDAALARERTVRARGWFAVVDATSHALFFATLGLWIVLAPMLVGDSAEAVTTPVIILLYLFMPLKRTLEQLHMISQAAVAMSNVTRLGMSLEPASDDLPAPTGAPRSFARVDLQGIEYRRDAHADRGFCLGPIDLELQPGQIVFLIGGNGSGKSTLAKVLTGLYAPTAGNLTLDGEPVTEANRDDYRQLFSVVLSDHHLFPELHRRAPALDAQARPYLARFGLETRVALQDSQFSTIELSTGQRKRLALITALLEDRAFYVLDEWAAEQDPAFKDFFYTELLPLLRERGKGIVVITHDDHYFHVADIIIKLEDGRLSQDYLRV